jgi:hypothetical protein
MSVPTASPRTQAEPMAFTFSEFLLGVSAACVAFFPLVGLANLLIGSGVVIVIVLSVAAVPVAALVFGPLAHLLGRTLRFTRRTAVHLAAFAALGLVVGVVTTSVVLLVMSSGRAFAAPDFWTPPTIWLFAPTVLAATGAVPSGWWCAAHRALRGDRRRSAAHDAAGGLA